MAINKYTYMSDTGTGGKKKQTKRETEITDRDAYDSAVRNAYADRSPSSLASINEQNAYDALQLAEYQNWAAQNPQAGAAAKTPAAPVTSTPAAATASEAASNGGLTAEEIKQLQMYLGTNQTGMWSRYDAQRAGADADDAWKAYQNALAWDFGAGGNPSAEARAFAAANAPRDYANWLEQSGEAERAAPIASGSGQLPAVQNDDALRDRILSLINGYETAEPFSYDPETDPQYSAYRKQYAREGQRATADTLGQAAAMTGGVPSSYAVTAAQQAGDYYAAQMADKIPELYQAAYARYMDDANRRMQTISMLNSLYSDDYQRNRDAIADSRYAEELAYQRSRDALADEEDNYNKELDRAQMLYELGDPTALYSILGFVPATTENVPASTSGSGYDNGGLTNDQIREMQRYYGTSADGLWGSNSRAAAGGLSAKDAWNQYIAGSGSTDYSGSINSYSDATAALDALGIIEKPVTERAWNAHKNGNSNTAEQDRYITNYNSYVDYLRDFVRTALEVANGI